MRSWDCRAVQHRFGEASAGILSPQDYRAWETHVAGCETCRAAWDRFQALLSGLEAVTTPQPPVDLRQRVLAQIHAQSRRRRASAGRLQWAWGVAVLLLLGLLWSSRQAPAPPWERAAMTPQAASEVLPFANQPASLLSRHAVAAERMAGLDQAAWVTLAAFEDGGR